MSGYFKDRGFFQSIIPSIQEGVNNYNVVNSGIGVAADIYNSISNMRAKNAARELGNYLYNDNSNISPESARGHLGVYESLHNPENKSHVDLINNARRALTQEEINNRAERIRVLKEENDAKTLSGSLSESYDNKESIDDQINKIDMALGVSSMDQIEDKDGFISKSTIDTHFGSMANYKESKSKYIDLMVKRDIDYLESVKRKPVSMENTKEIAALMRSLLTRRKDKNITVESAVQIDDALYAHRVEAE